jgi:hypothetical protein
MRRPLAIQLPDLFLEDIVSALFQAAYYYY